MKMYLSSFYCAWSVWENVQLQQKTQLLYDDINQLFPAWLFSKYIAHKTWRLIQSTVQGNVLLNVMGQETCELCTSHCGS